MGIIHIILYVIKSVSTLSNSMDNDLSLIRPFRSFNRHPSLLELNPSTESIQRVIPFFFSFHLSSIRAFSKELGLLIKYVKWDNLNVVNTYTIPILDDIKNNI